MALTVTALDPAEQRELKFRPQLRRDSDRILARSFASLGRPRGLAGRQVEQQQRALGQQRLAARRAQIVEHGQQHEGDVATTAEQSLDISG